MANPITHPDHPDPILTVIIHKDRKFPLLGLTGLCAGYESNQWRAKDFAENIIEWLPEFALGWNEWTTIKSSNAVKLLKHAARTVYETDKYGKRGEIGEILLHMAIRQVYQSLPAISKIYYKTSLNDPVKGFDSVHVVIASGKLELWLGESKFYKDIESAINDVSKELEEHTQIDYLKNEKMLISNKLSRDLPYYEKLKKLLDSSTSLDEVFDCACFPILLTYESDITKKHSKLTQDYKDEIRAEFTKHHTTLTAKKIARKIEIHLFLIPLAEKKQLVDYFHEELNKKK